MTDPAACPHETTEPVYAYLHHANPKVGDPVLLVNDGAPVARICTACHSQLHVGWGCPDCQWQVVELRRLCEPAPELIQTLIRPCQEHA